MQARLRGLYTDIGGARNFFKIKIHHDPKDPIGYYGLALCSMRERDWQKAINQLNKALELRPNELLFRRDLGICYANMGRFDFALSYLEGIPQDVKQAFYLGLGYKEKGNMDKAIKIWQLALNGFDPNLCVNVNDYSLILYHLSSAFSERDQMDWAHYYLGHYFKLEGNQQQASDHFKKAQELTKDQTLKTKIEKDGFIKEDQKRNKK
jgi:tetratricopeptide (TPR) repeat protein